VSNRPFLAKFELKGTPNQIGLTSSDRLRSAIVSWGTRDQEWHVVAIERLANKKVTIYIDGKDVGVRHWLTDDNLEGKIAIWLNNRESCSIRRFEVQTAPGK
jgi:hypothetical protein